ncbi:HPP family protein [Kocuria atrinae]|uniref:HPP family protein n=1 Tax=Kocuria atrinae TaxID=592377 RepID=UPI0002FC72D1|nr:HPP family protein [Kocuria atrinae]
MNSPRQPSAPSGGKKFSPVRLRGWPRESLPLTTIVAGGLGGALTIALLGFTGDLFGVPLLIAAFGSSCVLLFLVPDSPFSRPVSVVGGHVVAAACGLLIHSVLPTAWWSLGIAVGLAMIGMASLRVIHPPAGGTPIAILLSHQGWDYLLMPVLVGSLVLSACALGYRRLVRNVSASRRPDAADDSTTPRPTSVTPSEVPCHDEALQLTDRNKGVLG